ncbi:ribonuclease H-like domain-containing protein [Paenibacillus soyae]|uniref:Ribonuclease H-like domain-containing protein n=1 Tax=Paenibacillus soyae TaxID=2969249 RepID=A0A9X2MLM0_9BACL|nr:ribonuclease H-like domain-containing protein [Paenibacillus soyae]MCR2802884.1 ribonuclease H-like domain-containing protein [Paenibacillus soyae]
MSGLRDRMNRLRGVSAEAGPSASDSHTEETTVPQQPDDKIIEEAADEETLHPGFEAFGVRICRTEWGPYLVRRLEYPLNHRHGTHALGELVEAAPGLAAFHEEAGCPSPQSILYLDLETTGLGVGTGNVPFMIGIGYMNGESFVIEQSLIRHPAEEYAMMMDLKRKLRNFSYLATYNGKTFDWPLVLNRMIMNAIGSSPWTPLHLDFLHPSRSIWRNTLTSCKLSHIEEERLGIEREDDVPGSLAPQLYFQFLADGNPEPLEGVFRHNEIDLMSLACLSIRFGFLLQERIFERIPFPEEAEELVRTGLWLGRMGRSGLPEELFRLATLSVTAAPSSLLKLAAADKKAGNWDRAVLLWQKAIVQAGEQCHEDASEACVELAMYYEHRTKQLDLALTFAQQALERCQLAGMEGKPSAKQIAELEALQNRSARIRRKLDQERSRKKDEA